MVKMLRQVSHSHAAMRVPACQATTATQRRQDSGALAVRAYSAAMSADLTPRDAIELLLTAKSHADVHSGQVTLTVEQVDQIIGALGGVC
jgi:hypothetical protein